MEAIEPRVSKTDQRSGPAIAIIQTPYCTDDKWSNPEASHLPSNDSELFGY
jgi:hypothetical protein